MKLLNTYQYIWEADRLKQELIAAGIESITQENRPARKYESIVTGELQFGFQVLVASDDLLSAQKILANITRLDQKTKPVESIEDKLFYFDNRLRQSEKAIIFLSLLSLILVPILFNLMASFEYQKLRKIRLEMPTRSYSQGCYYILLFFWVINLGAFVLFFYSYQIQFAQFFQNVFN